MNKYHVWVSLEAEYDDIEANNIEEAFIEASDAAMAGGSWHFTIGKVEGDDLVDCEHLLYGRRNRGR